MVEFLLNVEDSTLERCGDFAIFKKIHGLFFPSLIGLRWNLMFMGYLIWFQNPWSLNEYLVQGKRISIKTKNGELKEAVLRGEMSKIWHCKDVKMEISQSLKDTWSTPPITNWFWHGTSCLSNIKWCQIRVLQDPFIAFFQYMLNSTKEFIFLVVLICSDSSAKLSLRVIMVQLSSSLSYLQVTKRSCE